MIMRYSSSNITGFTISQKLPFVKIYTIAIVYHFTPFDPIPVDFNYLQETAKAEKIRFFYSIISSQVYQIKYL